MIMRGISAILLIIFSHPISAVADEQLSEIYTFDLEQLAELRITTASLFYSYALDAPASVNVITRQRWQRQGARHMRDALHYLVGVQTTPSLAGADAVVIRGYTRSTSLFGVATTWDGVPLSDFFRGAPQLILPNINLGALDEIQLVQGPGSALYGSDAFHGVLALQGYMAETDEQEIQGTYYSDGYYSSSFRSSMSAFDDGRLNVALTATGQPDQDLVFQFDAPGSGLVRRGELDNRYQGQTMSTKLRTHLSDDLIFDGGVYLHRYRSAGFQAFSTSLSGARTNGGIDTDFMMTRASVERRFSDDRSLSFMTYYWWADSKLTAGRETPTILDFESLSEQQRYGVQVQWRDAFDSLNTRWALVGDWQQMEIDKAITNHYTTAGELISSAINPAANRERNISSLTFEANTRWRDNKWAFTYGARYDHYPGLGGQSSPRLGLIYHPAANSAIKLLYGHAFRAPTANEIHGTPGLVAGNPALSPEVIDTYELVLMHRTTQSLIQATLFLSHWDDGIVTAASGSSEPFIFENIERSNAKGLLLTWKRDFNPWLTEVETGWIESENETLSQNYKAFPKYTLDFVMSYHASSLNTKLKLMQSLRFKTDDLYPPSSGIAAQRLPTYRRTDISSFTPLSEQSQFSVYIHNLFDEENVQPSTTGVRGGIPDEPFTLGVELSYDF